ncbi:DUF2065 domain-containing protein [Hyphomonas pacifica]|uniref:Ubiquitin-binding protein n=1 Tax=Hyphomonas pacifica TaxID=1280941 RepID=A0A062U5F3_9PROT|nr:DUF2065 domain-containing protein [Hyphomonas pacifica]KCZ52983.1 hypothetical protein HY2_00230 [Hyphomonas pacifica]RAN36158.1 hypothetical protein HY3_00840 [Hyphomonas pacifica]RAN37828.1 hypothetical protein HY11_08055 [Hyphomonas pacifica]
MTLKLILIGIGFWFFFEGAIYAVAPEFMRRMADYLSRMPGREIALAGIGSAAIGAILIVIAVRWL